MRTVGLPYFSTSRLATMPMMPAGQVGWANTSAPPSKQRRVAGDLRLGALLDLVAQELAPGVERLQVGGEDAGAADVGSRQQIDAGVGVGQPPGRVEPRPQDEADVLLREPGRVELGFFHQRDQASPLRLTQGGQPALEQVAGVAALERQVSHDAQRDQVEVAGRVLRPPRPLVQRLGQLIGHAHAGQIGQRMSCAGCEQFGVDDRGGVRQGGAQLVMIGDDHVHALRSGELRCLVRGHAGVAGEDQPRALGDHLLQVRQVNAMRGGLAHRHVVADMRAQVAQRRDQQRGGGLAVHVEIAPHADRLAAPDGAPQPVDRPRHPRQRLRRGREVRIRVEESDRRGRGRHPAAREGLRHQRVAADRGGERRRNGDEGWFKPGSH